MEMCEYLLLSGTVASRESKDRVHRTWRWHYFRSVLVGSVVNACGSECPTLAVARDQACRDIISAPCLLSMPGVCSDTSLEQYSFFVLGCTSELLGALKTTLCVAPHP